MKRLATRFGVPVWCGTADREATETGRPVLSSTLDRPGLSTVANAAAGFDGTPVARTLAEGDSLTAGFTVLDTPGHSPGHVSFWREADRTLICGDVFFNMHLLTTIPGLRQPPDLLTRNPAENRVSERRLAALEPGTVGFGHGPVLSDDAARRLRDFVQRLSP
jgi:glyoxylase-like metal-dependent hydrolase (beta-lactamase superfamily II)